jgi:hypothetical protein
MSIAVIGELRDKRLQCGHCKCEIDIPDSYSATEEHRSEDGRFTYRKTVTRTDGTAPCAAPPTRFSDASPWRAADAAEGGVPANGLEQLHASIEENSALPDEVRRIMEELSEKGLIASVQASMTTRGLTQGNKQVATTTRFELRPAPRDTRGKSSSLASKAPFALGGLAAALLILMVFERIGLFVVLGVLVLLWWRRE